MPGDQTENRLRALEAGHDLLVQQNAELVVALRDIDQRIAVAVASALRAVLTDPATISSIGKVGGELLSKRAQEEAGGWLWKILRRFASDWIVRLAILYYVAKFAGFDAAAKLWSAMRGTT